MTMPTARTPESHGRLSSALLSRLAATDCCGKPEEQQAEAGVFERLGRSSPPERRGGNDSRTPSGLPLQGIADNLEAALDARGGEGPSRTPAGLPLRGIADNVEAFLDARGGGGPSRTPAGLPLQEIADNVEAALDARGGIDPSRTPAGLPLQEIAKTLADFLEGRGETIERELDDPDMLEHHAAQTRLDENGDVVSTNGYEDIDGELFVDGVSLGDIDQQQIADCYFMTALASLALTNPQAIENMITDNGDGTYTVHFGGDIGDVTVDDDFPVGPDGRPLYAGVGDAENPELWVAIVEKAFAQASGGYADIEYGRAHEAIAELTGHDDFTTGAPDSFEPEELGEALAEGRTVTASSYGGDKGDKIADATGIIGGHAYVVTDVRHIDGEWQVQLYNPWGSGEVGDDGTNDGRFWMSLDDFNAGFRDVQVMNTPLPEAA